MTTIAEEFFGLFKNKESENDLISLSNIDFNNTARSCLKLKNLLGCSEDEILHDVKNMVTNLDFSSIPFYVELKAIINYQTGEVYDDYEFYLKKENIEYSQVALDVFKNIKINKEYEIIETIREKDINRSNNKFIYDNSISNETLNDLREQIGLYSKYKNNFKKVMSKEDFNDLDKVMSSYIYIVNRFLDLIKNKNLITVKRKEQDKYLSLSTESFGGKLLIEQFFKI